MVAPNASRQRALPNAARFAWLASHDEIARSRKCLSLLNTPSALTWAGSACSRGCTGPAILDARIAGRVVLFRGRPAVRSASGWRALGVKWLTPREYSLRASPPESARP